MKDNDIKEKQEKDMEIQKESDKKEGTVEKEKNARIENQILLFFNSCIVF